MNCPRDDSELVQVVREGTKIDVCGRCRGKWLDAGELEQLVLAGTRTGATAAALKAALASAERPSFVAGLESEPELACPRCGVRMDEVEFQSEGATLSADRCPNCKGFWLDRGETGSLFVFLETKLPERGTRWGLLALLAALTFVVWWFLA